MSNQVILWSTIILPWLTLLSLKQEDIKRYTSVALFGTLGSTIVGEFAITLNWWSIKESIFPFYHILPFTYSAFLVGIIWIFKLTYGRFWLFLLINALFDWVLCFPLPIFFAQRGIGELINDNGFYLFVISIVHGVLLYGYQMWQEGIFIQFERTNVIPNLQPVVRKPLDIEEQDKKLD